MVATAEAPPKHRYRFDAERHVHLLDDRPLMGTSTVVGALGKPLTYWAAGCALTPLGWLNAKKSTKLERIDAAAKAQWSIVRELRPADYADFLQQCYHAHTKQLKDSASDGTRMHAELQYYVEDCIDNFGGEPRPFEQIEDYGSPAPEVFAKWALANVKRFLWSEKHCYSERLWVGGISDCGALLNDDSLAVIDFKSSKDAYFSQFVQCGGYSSQICENGLFCADGTEATYDPNWSVSKLIVFPFRGTKPRIERATPFMRRFEEVVNIYRHQQEYENQ